MLEGRNRICQFCGYRFVHFVSIATPCEMRPGGMEAAWPYHSPAKEVRGGGNAKRGQLIRIPLSVISDHGNKIISGLFAVTAAGTSG